MNTPTLYLMSKYTGREAESLKENQDAWLALFHKGYFQYSPICETHNIEEYRKEQAWEGCEKCLNFVLPIEDPICDNCSSSNNNYNPINKQIFKKPDYVARDLRLLESWCIDLKCKFDSIGGACYKPNEFQDPVIVDCDNYIQRDDGSVGHCELKYQPKVVGVVLPSGLSTVIDNEGNPQWSKGVRMEYEFMQSKHILVITLETALTVPPEQWKEYGL